MIHHRWDLPPPGRGASRTISRPPPGSDCSDRAHVPKPGVRPFCDLGRKRRRQRRRLADRSTYRRAMRVGGWLARSKDRGLVRTLPSCPHRRQSRRYRSVGASRRRGCIDLCTRSHPGPERMSTPYSRCINGDRSVGKISADIRAAEAWGRQPSPSAGGHAQGLSDGLFLSM